MNFLCSIFPNDVSGQSAQYTLDQAVSSQVARIGLAYMGKLHWTPDNVASYRTDHLTDGRVANDFKLLFWKSGADIPSEVTQIVKKIYEATRTNRLNLPSLKTCIDKNEAAEIKKHLLRMSCWEFYFLCLLESGIVSEEEIDQICTITAQMTREKRETAMVMALFDPFKVYTEYKSTEDVQTNCPKAGDLLLCFRPLNKDCPRHTLLSLGGCDYLELNFSTFEGVRRRSFMNWSEETWQMEPTLQQKILRIPYEEIARNVREFIATNSIFSTRYQRLPYNRLEEKLADTQRAERLLMLNEAWFQKNPKIDTTLISKEV